MTLLKDKINMSIKNSNFENKKLSIKDAQKLIDKMADILVTTNLQNKIITEETAKLDESFENSDDYVQRIDNVKKAIIIFAIFSRLSKVKFVSKNSHI